MEVYFLDCKIYPCYLTDLDSDQKFTNGHAIKVDTGGIQQQVSTTYLLRIAVIRLSFVVTILFVSYLCLTYRMKRDRAAHEDFIIINEWHGTIIQYFYLSFHCACTFEQKKATYFYIVRWLKFLSYSDCFIFV